MTTARTNTIDLCPYLPSGNLKKAKLTVQRVMQAIGMLIEGIVTLGIGLCFMAGVYIFLTLV